MVMFETAEPELSPDTAPDTAPATPVVELRGLRYTYPDGTVALQSVDVRVAPGEKVALVGPNGAGKSTLLLHLNGVLRSADQAVLIDGEPVSDTTIRRVRARVGMVFQDPDDQLFSPTVFDDVAFGPLHMGLGQRKRVAIATVLSMDPGLLALDEPSAGLDPRARRGLVSLLRTLPQAMIVSTHDMRMVAEVFPRMIVLCEGAVAYDGPSTPFLADEALLEQYGLERP
jgi:cobalt/nickel transport system ATP-binding protein